MSFSGGVHHDDVARLGRIGCGVQAAVRQDGDDLRSVVGQRKEGGGALCDRDHNDVRFLSFMDDLNLGAREAVKPIGCLGVDLVRSHEEQGNRLSVHQDLRAGHLGGDSAGLVELRPDSFVRADAGTEDRDDFAGSDGAGKKAGGVHDSIGANTRPRNVKLRNEGIAEAVEGQVGTDRDWERIFRGNSFANDVDEAIAVHGDAPAELIALAANVAGVDE